jgi:hypothetical protein
MVLSLGGLLVAGRPPSEIRVAGIPNMAKRISFANRNFSVATSNRHQWCPKCAFANTLTAGLHSASEMIGRKKSMMSEFCIRLILLLRYIKGQSSQQRFWNKTKKTLLCQHTFLLAVGSESTCFYPFFFLFGLWDYRHCGHSWPIVPATGDNEDDCGEHDGM